MKNNLEINKKENEIILSIKEEFVSDQDLDQANEDLKFYGISQEMMDLDINEEEWNEEMEPEEDEEESEDEEIQEEFEEYKDDFYGMIVGSINSIKQHADNILNSLEDPKVRENLTEPFLQQMAILAEDYMITVHNYVMFNDEPEEKMQEMDAAQKRGLWENIRRKKKRMGKNYKPAQPGSKDRPTPEAIKQAQGSDEWDGETFYNQEDLLRINPSLANCEEVVDDFCEDCE